MSQSPFPVEAAVRFKVLGPFELSYGGDTVPLNGARQTKLLAVLALNLQVTVPFERIVDALWDSPPDSMRQQIYNTVRGLRKALVRLPSVEIESVEGGYRLLAPPGSLDLAEFQEIVRSADTTEAAGDIGPAADLLAAALAMWRGPALGGLDGRFIQGQAALLDEQRIVTLERLAALRIRLGTGFTLVGALFAAVAEEPFRETLRAALMLGLQQSGRQADALAVYEEGRELLARELGLDPGQQLRAVHTAVLNGQVATVDSPAAPGPLPADQTDDAPSGSFLPRDTSEFTGRTSEIAQMIRMARSGSSRALVISSIEGMGGVGKTALAVHLAHRLAAEYPDGHYFVDLHGYSPGTDPVEPGTALEMLLSESGLPIELIPFNPEARSALWRSRLTGRRVLVLLDNAVDEGQVRPLLPGSPDALVLVTSRRRLTALEDNHPLLLEGLSAAEGAELFVQIAGPDRTADRAAEVDEVVKHCGGLPLAIRIAAARFRDRRGWGLPDLLDQLRTHQRRVRFLATGDRNVMSVLRLSYLYLSPVQQRMFRLLSLTPTADFEPYAVAALTGISVEEAETSLETLLECSLLIQHTAGRYEFHDLVRDCSRQLCAEQDTAEIRQSAIHRLLDYYLYVAYRCCRERAIGPFRFEPTVEHAPGQVPDLSEPFDQDRFLLDNYRGFVAVGRFAQDNGWLVHAWQLPCALVPFLSRRNYSSESMDLYIGARDAAKQLNDTHGEVASLMATAVIARDRGNTEDAQELFRQALVVSERHGELSWQAQLLTDLGVSQINGGQVLPAEDSFSRAKKLADELGNERLSSALVNNLGVVCREMGRLPEALELFGQASARGNGGSRLQITTLINFGLVYHLQDKFGEAQASFDRALELCHESGAENREAIIQAGLSVVHRSLGDLTSAVEHGRRSLIVARRFALAEIECMALNSLGEAFVSLADLETAETVYREAADASDRRRMTVQSCRAIEGMAHVSLARGELANARRQWQRTVRQYPAGLAAADYARRHLDSLGLTAVTCPRCATAIQPA